MEGQKSRGINLGVLRSPGIWGWGALHPQRPMRTETSMGPQGCDSGWDKRGCGRAQMRGAEPTLQSPVAGLSAHSDEICTHPGGKQPSNAPKAAQHGPWVFRSPPCPGPSDGASSPPSGPGDTPFREELNAGTTWVRRTTRKSTAN